MKRRRYTNGNGKWAFVFLPFPAASCSKYSHPEIRIFARETIESQHFIADPIITITYQRHRVGDGDFTSHERICKDGLSYGYAFRMKMNIDNYFDESYMKDLTRLISKLNCIGGIRKLMKVLRSLKIPRYVEVEVLENDHYRDRFVPRRFKKTAQLYLDAQKAGYSLAS
jgi:hypothetical protein